MYPAERIDISILVPYANRITVYEYRPSTMHESVDNLPLIGYVLEHKLTRLITHFALSLS